MANLRSNGGRRLSLMEAVAKAPEEAVPRVAWMCLAGPRQSEKEKDTILDNNPFDESLSGPEDKEKSDDITTLENFLMANDIDVYKLSHSGSVGVPQANEALEEVLVLKRLLVRNIRLSMDEGHSQALDKQHNSLGHNPHRDFQEAKNENQKERQKSENVHNGLESETGAEENWKEASIVKQKEDRETTMDVESGADAMEGGAEEALTAPIILSMEQSEEVHKKIVFLEQRLRELKVMEEEYFHLQQVIAKFTSSQQSFS